MSNEHPEVLERTKPTPELRERVLRGIKMLAKAKRMRVTSQAGTELRAFAGNFLYSTGANETAGRSPRT